MKYIVDAPAGELVKVINHRDFASYSIADQDAELAHKFIGDKINNQVAAHHQLQLGTER